MSQLFVLKRENECCRGAFDIFCLRNQFVMVGKFFSELREIF